MANLRPNLETALFNVLNVASLTNLATGGVFNSVAPEQMSPPFVVFQHVSETDDYWAYIERGQQALYIVKVISRSPWPKQANDIYTQVDSLLQDATLSITGFTQVYCRRESAFDSPEPLDGVMYQHIGGIYRVIADE